MVPQQQQQRVSEGPSVAFDEAESHASFLAALAVRFPSTRLHTIPGATRTPLGLGMCPWFKGHFLSRRARPLSSRFATFAFAVQAWRGEPAPVVAAVEARGGGGGGGSLATQCQVRFCRLPPRLMMHLEN
jgi:hypothetical protein